MKINPYLNFLGNTREALGFYQKVFKSTPAFMQTFKDAAEHLPNMKKDEEDNIMHADLPVGESHLMASDTPPDMKNSNRKVNVSLTIVTDSKEEAKRIFEDLSEGGEITVPIEDQFWNAYFGMCKDRFGVQWMVNFDYPPPS